MLDPVDLVTRKYEWHETAAGTRSRRVLCGTTGGRRGKTGALGEESWK